MIHPYAVVGLFLLVSVFSVSHRLRWRGSLAPEGQSTRQQVYESGNPTFGETWIEYKAQYYLFGLAFLAFDVEAAFLFPWALATYNQLTLYAVLEAAVLGILGIGLIYVWRKRWLEWM